MNSSPRVSILMNCLNGEEYLADALDSIYAQTFGHWEIVFWDNNSSDRSAEIARGYDSRIKYFKSDETYLLGKARNLALAQAKGPYIALLDVDDLWLPSKLEYQIALMESDENIGLVYSDFIFFDDSGEKYNHHSMISPRRGMIFGDLLKNNFIGTLTMVYRKSYLNKLGLMFNEGFTMVMDFELSLKLARSYAVDYIDAPLAKWRRHEKNESRVKQILSQEENTEMLSALIREYPEIEEQYGKSIASFRKYISYNFALAEWNAGNHKVAKTHLRPYLGNGKILLTAILITFLNYAQYESVKSFIKTVLGRIKR